MSSPHILFEQLENAGYIQDGGVNLDRVKRASVTEIVDLSAESAALTSAELVPHNRGAFFHSASLSLGGERYPCHQIVCRLERVDQLSQFAALYSDGVYIHNFLSDYAVHPEAIREEDETQAALVDDLEILLRLRPLIEAGRVFPVTAPKSWCPHCLRVRIDAIDDFDPRMTRGLSLAGERLRRRFLSETHVTMEKRGKEYAVLTSAPEDLIEHGSHAFVYSKMPDVLHKLPEVRRLLERGRSVRLSRRQLEKLESYKAETAAILENVLFELTISQSFGTSFLTERPLHLAILRSVAESSHQDRRNALIRKHLTTMVPFLDGLSQSELIKLRAEEGDSFVLFRQALNHAMDEAGDESNDFTERQARELYGDVLEPSLARLDLKLRSAQSALAKTARRRTVTWVGAITFGIFSGLLPAGLASAAKVLGLTKVLADLGESLLQSGRDENVIRNEDMYFLWKVRKASR